MSPNIIATGAVIVTACVAWRPLARGRLFTFTFSPTSSLIGFGHWVKIADDGNSAVRLRACGEGPRRCGAERSDKCAPPHSITSSEERVKDAIAPLSDRPTSHIVASLVIARVELSPCGACDGFSRVARPPTTV
jgi:hypothetical protein